MTTQGPDSAVTEAQIRASYDAFHRRDVDAILEVFDPQIEWVHPDGMMDLGLGGTKHGHDGVRQFLAHVPTVLGGMRLQPEEFIVTGDRAIVLGTREVTTLDGRTATLDFLHSWTFREGRAVRMEDRFDTAAMRRLIEPDTTGRDGTSTGPMAIDSATQDLLFRDAHTAHTFTDESVTDEQVEAIHQLIKFAPTSLNGQPLRGVLVRSESARERLVGQMAPMNREKTSQAPLTVVLAADLEFHDELPKLVPFLPNARDIFADPKARREAALLNSALQIGYFIVGVRAAGLAAGPMSGFDAQAVSKEFFPDGDHEALVVMNIGKPGPDASRPRAPRLDYPEVFTVA